MGETPDSWRACVNKAIALQPDCLTIYQMEVPYNTTIYQQMTEQGQAAAPVADWETKRQWVREAFEALEGAGYTVTSAYTAVRDPERTRFVYRDSLWTGADMLSLGVSAFGFINHTHLQNHKDMGPYLERINDRLLPIYRALKINDEEGLIRQLVLQMKLGRIDRSYFLQHFGVDIDRRFAQPLGRLTERGFLERDGETLRLSREALLQVDWLLHVFFLPQHRDARYT